MKLLIAGSRTITDMGMLKFAIKCLDRDIDEIISGGATGVDTLAEQYAETTRIPIKVFPADWKRNGKGAGFIRHEQMVKEADSVLVLWDGKSKGTLHTIKLARTHNKKLFGIIDSGAK